MPPAGSCVLGTSINRDENPSFPPPGGAIDTQVIIQGAPKQSDAVAGATLATTGAGALSLLLLSSLGLMSGGVLLSRRSKKS